VNAVTEITNGNPPSDDAIEDTFEDSVVVATEPFATFESLAGYEETTAQIERTVVEPATYDQYGLTSALLFGESEQSPVSELAATITGAFDGYTFFHVGAVVGDFMEDANSVETTFRAARERSPSLVILDCLDEYSFDGDEYDRLRSHLDTIQTSEDHVLVVATATNDDADLVDNDDLFEVRIDVPEPDDTFRQAKLREALQTAEDAGVATFDGLERTSLADLETGDLSVTDIQTAVKRAIHTRRRDQSASPPVSIRQDDLRTAIDQIESEQFEESASSGFFGHGMPEDQFEPDIPDVTFDEIGGLDAEKRRLREAVTIPVEYSDTFRQAGYSVGQGILLHGPPGNGKTMLAKAVANELSYHFLSVKGPELEQPLVGESERELRELFGVARDHAPSVIFFDEFDSLAPRRAGDSYDFKNDLVNTLLSELDGLESLEDVVVLAATNRLDRLDPAVLRSGRFDTFIDVSPPDTDEAQAIFEIHASDLPLTDAVTPEWFTTLDVASLSGADIETVCRKSLEFAVCSFDEGDRETLEVSHADIERALDHLRSEPTTDDELPEFR
jgi:SpoVK/Ycf46/Vps4 family AAA+-type ATPase